VRPRAGDVRPHGDDVRPHGDDVRPHAGDVRHAERVCAADAGPPDGRRDEVPTITGEPGSFARAVLEQRHPAIVDQVRSTHPYGPEQHRRLDRLLAEALHGVVEPPERATDADERWPDRRSWAAWLEPWRGLTWFHVPFLVAESWFYRRLLDAVGFVEPGPWRWVDPFAPPKVSELRLLAPLAAPPEHADREALLAASLWGNQADLGFQLVARAAAVGGAARGVAGRDGEVIVDQSARLWELLDAGGLRVAWICDNAGRELVADLLLVDRLLADGLASSVTLHLKPLPYFVSDATARDFVDCLEALGAAGGGAAVARLRSGALSGALTVAADPFWCTPLELRDRPARLDRELSAADLVILKGDLNYRRLVGDAVWPPTTPFAEVVQLPGRVAVLRTLKSDVVVGLDPATVAALDPGSPGWRTDGRHALVQVRG